MTRDDLAARSAALRAARVPFVRAKVVLAERPTSAKPGDEALVLADGTIEGFVGGTCAEATVREQSLALLATGEALVVRITPIAEDPLATAAGGVSPVSAGRVVVHNPCLSGGSLEVFLEPEVPPPLVLVAGHAPIADALVALGRQLRYDVRALDGPIPVDAAAVVVAAHGRGEEDVLVEALSAGVPFVGLVASRRRGAAVVESLDVAPAERDRIHTPAGLDIGARTPEEVALSILAEIVASRPRIDPATAAGIDGLRPETAGVDPVCGMTVASGADAIHVEHDGRTVWFCGSGCRRAFLADPAKYPA